MQLDIFYQKWNSHHDGDGLASQFWQMKIMKRFETISCSQETHTR